MRFAARVLLPGTGWIAFTQLMDLVGLMMDLLGKRFLPRGSLALLDFHTIRAVCEATISFRVRRPAFSSIILKIVGYLAFYCRLMPFCCSWLPCPWTVLMVVSNIKNLIWINDTLSNHCIQCILPLSQSLNLILNDDTFQPLWFNAYRHCPIKFNGAICLQMKAILRPAWHDSNSSPSPNSALL